MSIYSSTRRPYHQRSHLRSYHNPSSTSVEESFFFSNLEEAGSYLQSSAAKMKDYLAIHQQNNSKSLAYSESNYDYNESQRYYQNRQTKVQKKTPIMKSTNKQIEFKDRINKLGLQNLMKEMITSQKDERIGAQKAIQILNKTYINDKIQFKHQGMVATIGRKSSKNIKKKTSHPSVFVNWDPETIERDLEFKEVLSFIPNQMFPCRNNQTRMLKSKQKNRKNYVSSQPFYGISPKNMRSQEPSIHSSARLLGKQKKIPLVRPMTSHLERNPSLLQKNRNYIEKRRSWSARDSIKSPTDKIYTPLNKLLGPQPNDPIKAKKAKIYK